jgi:hypothetical protein
MIKKILLLNFLNIFISLQVALADDVDNLVEVILKTSPTERKKAEYYLQSEKTLKNKSESKPEKKSSPSSITPSLEIPDDQIFDVSAKFPKDIIGKYVSGSVKINYVSPLESDFYMTFSASNNRGFFFETKNPEAIKELQKYKSGDTLMIPKNCPLKIYHKTFTAAYWVKLPFD